MNVPRQLHTSTLLNDGTAPIAGGFNFTGPSGSAAYESPAEPYHPDSGTFELVGSYVRPACLAHGDETLRRPCTDRGWHQRDDDAADGGLYQFGSKSFSAAGLCSAAGSHTRPRCSTTGGCSWLAATGRTQRPVGGNVRSALNTFTATAHPLLSFRSRHTATLLPDGHVLLAGGTGSPTAELFDSPSGTFTSAGTLTTPRVDHTASLLDDGSVLLAGGLDDATNCCPLIPPQASMERYVPGTGFIGAGSMTASRYQHTASTVTVAGVHKILLVGTFGWSFTGSRSGELYTPLTNVGLTNPAPPDGNNGIAYPGFTLAGTGGAGGPYGMSLVAGHLPDGLS